jgi:hypothetical protein
MKYSLLDMTQKILSSMDSDAVNSITDTVESAQVAEIIRTTYYDIISSLNLPEHYELFELTASSSSTPTVMTLPTNVIDLVWLKYDNKLSTESGKKYVELAYWPLKDFMDSMHSLNGADSNVSTYTLTTNGSDSMDIMCQTDRFPTRYTTFNDNTIIFDAYKLSEDAYLQKNKTAAWGQTIPTWSHTDSFVPDLDAKQFTLLLNEAKGQAFIELKQQVNAKAEKRARRGWINAARDKSNFVSGYGQRNTVNYGRK